MAAALSVARYALRPFVQSWAVSMGWGAGRIRRELVSRFGSSYRWQDIQQDVRSATGLFKKEPLVRKLDPKLPAAKSSMVEIKLPQPYNYRILAEAQYNDLKTGESRSTIITIYDDVNRGEEGWGDDYIDRFSKMPSSMDYTYSNIVVRSIEHFAGRPY